MESLGRYSFLVMIFVILSGVVNMRNEHVCIHSWGAVCSDSWVWRPGQRRRSDGQIKGLGWRLGELYVAIPGFGGLVSGDGRTDRLMVWEETQGRQRLRISESPN